MKKLILLLASATICVSAFAQNPTMVTPSPAAGLSGGLGVNADAAATYHFKIGAGDIRGLGAATSGDLLLFTTEQDTRATAILQVWIAPTVRVRGGGLSAVTAQVRGVNSYGSTSDVYTTTSTVPVNKYIYAQGDLTELKGQAINLHLVSTGDNLNMAATGTIDVYVTRLPIR